MSLKLDAYNEIKRKILYCEYMPSAMLNEEMLREELHMSRTPIRDALSRLEQENLVSILPKKGFKVSPITANDVEKLYELRLLLERHAIINYGKNISVEAYEQMAEYFSRSIGNVPTQQIYDEDDAFHTMFLCSGDNPYMLQAYSYPQIQNARLRIMSGNLLESRLEASQGEHLLIVKHCLAKSWDKAADALEEHLMVAKSTFYSLMNRGLLQ